MTRAEERLCLVTFGKESPLLPALHSPLVRGELEEEEEDDGNDEPIWPELG